MVTPEMIIWMPALNPFFSTEVPRNDDLCSQPELPIMSAPPIVEKRSREVYSVMYVGSWAPSPGQYLDSELLFTASPISGG